MLMFWVQIVGAGIVAVGGVYLLLFCAGWLLGDTDEPSPPVDPLLDERKLLRDLDSDDRLLFVMQYGQKKKSPTLGVLAALFLGGIGAHRFYLNEIGWGVLYLLFFWTWIPMLIAFVEAFVMPDRVRAYNLELGMGIRARLQAQG